MIINSYNPPRSSFLSVEKDMSIITEEILKNERLKKLLYYTTPDAMDRPAIGDEKSIEMFGKNIKIVPKLTVDKSVLNYIIVSFDNFITNPSNPEFRDNVIEFDIICHFDQWNLKDFQLRPYRIAAELDTMFDKKRLTGIGLTEFAAASQIILTDEFAGLCLMYKVYHGEEDKRDMLNPADQEQLIKDWMK